MYKKGSARAAMRRMGKRLLRKYKYLLEKAEGTVDVVVRQAEFTRVTVKLYYYRF